ncbi:hypothetical protein PRZ48_010222 [Zasmidium cellare]|uniref:Uncharacterized protein n=1 Tax=Zasmidium cellare TaxID=395010 RepID=A0ABR0EDX3_ZASCE|nr:hypothetical protein PRZ48_010222 [Zasmidium cellare]
MSLQDGDALERRIQERMQLLLEQKALTKEQKAINREMLELMDEQDRRKGNIPPSSAQAPLRTQTEPARQQQTPSSRNGSVAHDPNSRMSEPSTQVPRQQKHSMTDAVAPSQAARKRKKEGSSQTVHVPESDSEDDRPLLPRKKKNRKPSATNTEASREAAPSTATTPLAPPTIVRKPPAEKYKIFRLTPDYKYDMVVVVGDQVVELACCFCGGNHFKHKKGWKPIVGVHGMQKHIQLSHKDDEHEDTDRRGFDWVVKNCVRKILLKSEIRDVEDNAYYVEEVHDRTLADRP